MKGDVTRETFRAERHYWGVLRQQGRVDIDADWNEQVRIARHHDVVRTADLVGSSGGPVDGAGFALSVDAAGSVGIARGRYYVAGILVENDIDVPLDDQPDPPGDAAPTTAGLHLAYLDVWDRHTTALDDPTIREVALGGPDTATRARSVWQVRTQSLLAVSPGFTAAVAALAAARTDSDEAAEAAALQELRNLARAASCASPLAPVDGSLADGTGTMAARAEPDSGTDDLCSFGRGGSYTRLENRLYRVEIHDPGDDVAATAATFKWSRDNGSVVVSVVEFRNTGGGSKTTELVVRGLGLDDTQELHRDDWIEVVSDDLIESHLPGQLVQIAVEPDPADRILVLSGPVDIKAPSLHPQVRRWDLPVGGLAKVRKTWQDLEAGIQVRFGAGTFHTGDYWVIPVRANTGEVEWPPYPDYPGHHPQSQPEQRPPSGIAHWRAPIAALVHDGTQVVASIDLRALFPGATDLHTFGYVGGDGQEPVLPSGDIPQPLQVSVTNGTGPVAGVLVEFEVDPTSDTLAGAGQSGGTVVVPTGPDGVASAGWTVDPTVVDHRVTARLLDDCLTPTHAPIVFSSHVNPQLHYLGGDGQEGMPGEEVEPLRAWVSAGRWPVEGAAVQFTVTLGNGAITPSGPTASDGQVTCSWRLDQTTPRQQVQAQLVDAAGNPVHDASLTFTAILSLARRVAFTPDAACSDLASATTVQEALDELCRRETGGECTHLIRAGDDLAARWAQIQASGFLNGSICFTEGSWRVEEPLRLFRRGHITIHGLGRASRVVASPAETAFQFEGCASVTFTDLAVETRGPTTHDGLGGAVSMVNCGPVSIERITVVGGHAPEPLSAGISVTRGPESQAAGPLRIRDCDLATGEQQAGVLVVNPDVVHIEGNTLRAVPFREGVRLREFLGNARYRAAARRQLVDPAGGMLPGPAPTIRPGTRPVRLSLGADGDEVNFLSTMTSVDVWTSILRGSGRSPREVLAAAVTIADNVLRNEGALGNRRVFRAWFDEQAARWEAIGARGIVVAGVRAEDVRIVGNSIGGHLQGISVALSANDRVVYRTTTAMISGNTIRLPGWSLLTQRTEGIFLGNCDGAVIDDNTVIVGGGVDSEPEILADGIRAGGAFGARLLIRSNHVDAAVVGIRVEPTQTPPSHMRRWAASDNVNVGGACLEAPCEVMEDANVPARQSGPCPLDRPL